MTLGLAGSVVMIAVGSLAIATIVWGIIWIVRTILKEPDLSPTAKTIWLIALLAAPILSIVAWFIFRNVATRQYS